MYPKTTLFIQWQHPDSKTILHTFPSAFAFISWIRPPNYVYLFNLIKSKLTLIGHPVSAFILPTKECIRSAISYRTRKFEFTSDPYQLTAYSANAWLWTRSQNEHCHSGSTDRKSLFPLHRNTRFCGPSYNWVDPGSSLKWPCDSWNMLTVWFVFVCVCFYYQLCVGSCDWLCYLLLHSYWEDWPWASFNNTNGRSPEVSKPRNWMLYCLYRHANWRAPWHRCYRCVF